MSNHKILSDLILNINDLSSLQTEPEFLEGNIETVTEEILQAIDQKRNQNVKRKEWYNRRIISDSSLTVGIHGLWGSGKTTVSNLLLQRLEAKGMVGPKIFFSAWEPQGKEYSLSQRLLLELSRLNINQKDSKIDFKEFSELEIELAEKVNRFRNRFNGLRWIMAYLGVFIFLVLILPILFLSIPILNNFAKENLNFLYFPPEITVFFLQGLLFILGGLLAWIEIKKAKLGMQTPHQAAGKLFEKFFKVKKENTVFIVLDDIDRLSKDEIPELFKLLRVTINFPNLIWIIPYDSVVVFKALEEGGLEGERYFRKILDLNYRILMPSRNALIQELKQDLLIALLTENEVDFEEYPLHLISHLQNRRDARLFFTRVYKLYAILPKATIYPVKKLLVLEYIRESNPALWNNLSDNKSYLTNQYLEDEEEEKLNIERLIDNHYRMFSFLRKASPEEKILVSYVFPWISAYLSSSKKTKKAYFADKEAYKDSLLTHKDRMERTFNYSSQAAPSDNIFTYKDVVKSYFDFSYLEDNFYVEKIENILNKIFPNPSMLKPTLDKPLIVESLHKLTPEQIITLLKTIRNFTFHPETQITLLEVFYEVAKLKDYPSDRTYALKPKSIFERISNGGDIIEGEEIYRVLLECIKNWTHYYISGDEERKSEAKTIWLNYLDAEAPLSLKIMVSLAFGGKHLSYTKMSEAPKDYSHGWNSGEFIFAPDIKELFNTDYSATIKEFSQDPLSTIPVYFWISWLTENHPEVIKNFIDLLISEKNFLINHYDRLIKNIVPYSENGFIMLKEYKVWVQDTSKISNLISQIERNVKKIDPDLKARIDFIRQLLNTLNQVKS